MIGQLFNTLANCLKIPELRSRILFTALVLAVARVIALTPVPGLDGSKLALYFAETAKTSGGGVGGDKKLRLPWPIQRPLIPNALIHTC